jgi:hypothetical protein
MPSAYCRALGRLIQDIEAGVELETIRASLSAANRQTRPRHLDVRVLDGELRVNDVPMEAPYSPEVETLTTAFTRHQLTGITIKMGTTPRELLQLAALLAEQVAEGEASNILDAVERFGFWHVTLHGAGRSTQAGSANIPAPLPLADAAETDTQVTTAVAALAEAIDQSSAVAVVTVMSQALATLDSAEAKLAEASGAGDKEAIASANAVVEKWRAGFASLAIPPALTLITELVVSNEYPAEETVRIIQRAGDDAISALMTQLTAATSVYHRRLFFNAIVDAGTGVSVLAAHLGHPSWYVVRNAACLLGAMRAVDAEPALIRCLSHADERVRVSVATALLQLETPSGRRALEKVYDDSSDQVRRRVLESLLRDNGVATSAAILGEALDLERDPAVQLEVVSTLRAMGTPHAVRQLVRLCSPSVCSNKTSEFKRAAIEALWQLRPTAAAPLLRLRVHDRDPEIRAHAVALLARAPQAA